MSETNYPRQDFAIARLGSLLSLVDMVAQSLYSHKELGARLTSSWQHIQFQKADHDHIVLTFTKVEHQQKFRVRFPQYNAQVISDLSYEATRDGVSISTEYHRYAKDNWESLTHEIRSPKADGAELKLQWRYVIENGRLTRYYSIDQTGREEREVVL
jgi:hypothetical protein